MRGTVAVYDQVTKKQEKPLIVKEWHVILVIILSNNPHHIHHQQYHSRYITYSHY